MTQFEKIAAIVDDAAFTATAIPQLSLSGHELSIPDAYKVQKASIARRIGRGETLIGMKMGFTSRAKMLQMGLSDLIWGHLTSGMLLEDCGTLTMAKHIHPRIEPEVCFLLKKPLEGNVSLLEAQAAVEAVCPALEVIDSRYKNFKFSLADVVADNSSSAGIVLGAWRRPLPDISNLGMCMAFNGRPLQMGSSAAILGNPYRSLVSAARLVAESGLALQPGWIVMAGGATAAEALKPGVHVTLDVENLGRTQITAA